MRSPAVRTAVVTALVLLVPLVATRVSDEVHWTPGDFLAAGLLIFGAGTVYHVTARGRGSVTYRAAVGGTIAAVLIVVWISLAV